MGPGLDRAGTQGRGGARSAVARGGTHGHGPGGASVLERSPSFMVERLVGKGGVPAEPVVPPSEPDPLPPLARWLAELRAHAAGRLVLSSGGVLPPGREGGGGGGAGSSGAGAAVAAVEGAAVAADPYCHHAAHYGGPAATRALGSEAGRVLVHVAAARVGRAAARGRVEELIALAQLGGSRPLGALMGAVAEGEEVAGCLLQEVRSRSRLDLAVCCGSIDVLPVVLGSWCSSRTLKDEAEPHRPCTHAGT